MGFSLKKVLKKAEKAVKKVAPAALTVVNPALGATVMAAQKAVAAAKAKSAVVEDTSAQVVETSYSGYTGMTTPSGLVSVTASAPPVPRNDTAAFRNWANNGNAGLKSAEALFKSPVIMIVAAFGVFLLLILLIRRK